METQGNHQQGSELSVLTVDSMVLASLEMFSLSIILFLFFFPSSFNSYEHPQYARYYLKHWDR